MDKGTSATLACTDSRPVVKDALGGVSAHVESTGTKEQDDGDGPLCVPIHTGPPDPDSNLDKNAPTTLARTDSRPDVREALEDSNQQKKSSEFMKTKVSDANISDTRMGNEVPNQDLSDKYVTSNARTYNTGALDHPLFTPPILGNIRAPRQ